MSTVFHKHNNVCPSLRSRGTKGSAYVALALCLFLSGDLVSRAQVFSSWDGMTNTGWNPPDPHGAAGPEGVLQTVNLKIAYFSKAGALIWGPVQFTNFFSSVGVSVLSWISDPKAIYDPQTGRFYVILQEDIGLEPLEEGGPDRVVSSCYVAVSKTSSPASGGATNWLLYRFSMTETNGDVTYGGDYPGLGVDGQALYVTYNMWTGNANDGVHSPFRNCQILILSKTALTNGTATAPTKVFTPNGDANGFTLQPASPVGGNPSNVVFFCETPWNNATNVRVWALSDPLGTPALTNAFVAIPNNGGRVTDGAPQNGTSATLDTLSPHTQGNAFWFNGAVWFCHTAGGTSGPAKVYYYRVNLNNFPNGTPTLGESGVIDGGTGVWTFQPAIGANAQGDVCIVFTSSSTNTYPSIAYTFRTASATNFQPPLTLFASSSFAGSGGPGPGRWGDFATVASDPTDGTFWISHEYSRGTAEGNWGTLWGNIFIRVYPLDIR